MPYQLVNSEATHLSEAECNHVFDTYEDACAYALTIVNDLREKTMRWHTKHQKTFAEIYAMMCDITQLHCCIEDVPLIVDVVDMKAYQDLKRHECEVIEFKRVGG